MKPREKPKRGTAVTVTAERAYKIIRAQLEGGGFGAEQGFGVISHVEGGVTKANYRMVWEWVNDHYARLCEVEIDGQCKNATRMSVLCHDPEALLRPEASTVAFL